MKSSEWPNSKTNGTADPIGLDTPGEDADMSRKVSHPEYGLVRVLELRGFVYRCREAGGSNEYLIGFREMSALLQAQKA